MQSRLHSWFETLTQVTTGYAFGILLQLVVFPIYNIQLPIHQNLEIGVIFTAASTIRSYIIRRWFNNKTANRLS